MYVYLYNKINLRSEYMLNEILARDSSYDWEDFLLLYKFALAEMNTKITILNEEFQLIHAYNPIEHIKSSFLERAMIYP